MNDALPYRTMAYNNAWANRRLLTACAQLSPDEFTAKRTGFFPSLRATLNHILIIDHFYVDAMEGGTLGPAAWADQEPCATVAALKEAQAAVDRRLLKIVEALDGAGLQRIVSVHRGTSIQRERMDRLLLHLFQHQVHHRGQAHAMLSSTSVSPPQLDEFFSVGEAPLRAAEFAELGWTEERIWGGDAGTSVDGGYLPNMREIVNDRNPPFNSPFQSIRTIDYTVILVRDMAAMRRFYEGVLRFPLTRELSAGWIEYQIGGNTLALSRPGRTAKDAPTPTASLQLAFKVAVDDVDRCADELVRHGVDLLEPPTNQPFGHRTLFFRDPDGNLLEVYAEI